MKILTYLRTKKCLIVTIVFLIILLYVWPSWLPLSRSHTQQLLSPHRWLTATERPLVPAEYCLESKLEKFTHGVETYDVILNHVPLLSAEKFYLPYIGNGYIGVAVTPSSQLHIKKSKTLSFALNFYPIVEIGIEGAQHAEAVASVLKEGVVHRIETFHLQDEACIDITSISYANRYHPSVLVQELRIHNPTDRPVVVDLRQIGASDWKDVVLKDKRVAAGRGSGTEYTIYEGGIPADSDSSYAVAIASVKVPQSVTVKKVFTSLHVVVTVVRYELVAVKSMQQKIHELSQFVEKELEAVLNVETKVLRSQHSTIWTGLWSSGFGISLSLASGALNGDKINATMYYVLSQTSSPIFEYGRSQSERSELENVLYFPDRCYDGHHTLQNEKMWRNFDRLDDVLDSARTWLVTLDKNGCGKMLTAGADGVLQAMILSYGALKFSNHHLEFGTHPRDLHRDYHFRRINYGNDTHVNISVRVGNDNKAVLFVSLDRNNRPYYACDAGCIDPPVPLGREIVNLPVKLTDPVTPILYIADDKAHLTELRYAIHFREINEAPAHEQHVMVLHKHGHHFGGLPMLFWGTITILIVLFHMFLFKLIYNEYCSGAEPSATGPRLQRHTGRYV